MVSLLMQSPIRLDCASFYSDTPWLLASYSENEIVILGTLFCFDVQDNDMIIGFAPCWQPVDLLGPPRDHQIETHI